MITYCFEDTSEVLPESSYQFKHEIDRYVFVYLSFASKEIILPEAKEMPIKPLKLM